MVRFQGFQEIQGFQGPADTLWSGSPRHYPNGKFLLVREIMLSIYLIRTGRNSPNGKSDSYKMELELKYGFWNFNFFLDWYLHTII